MEQALVGVEDFLVKGRASLRLFEAELSKFCLKRHFGLGVVEKANGEVSHICSRVPPTKGVGPRYSDVATPNAVIDVESSGIWSRARVSF